MFSTKKIEAQGVEEFDLKELLKKRHYYLVLHYHFWEKHRKLF